MGLEGVNPWGPFGPPELHPSDFEALTKGQGIPVSWEKAIFCPRRTANDIDKHDFNCPVCESRFGIVYYDTKTILADGSELRALVTGIPVQQRYRVEGWLDAGSAYISLPVECVPAWGDRITLVKSRLRVSQLVKRDASTIDLLKWKALLPAENGGVVRCIDNDGVDRTAAVSINAAGNAVWAGSAPAAGTWYALSYYRRPMYIVLDLPHAVRDTIEKFPEAQGTERTTSLGTQVLGKLDFLVRDESLAT